MQEFQPRWTDRSHQLAHHHKRKRQERHHLQTWLARHRNVQRQTELDQLLDEPTLDNDVGGDDVVDSSLPIRVQVKPPRLRLWSSKKRLKTTSTTQALATHAHHSRANCIHGSSVKAIDTQRQAVDAFDESENNDTSRAESERSIPEFWAALHARLDKHDQARLATRKMYDHWLILTRYGRDPLLCVCCNTAVELNEGLTIIVTHSQQLFDFAHVECRQLSSPQYWWQLVDARNKRLTLLLTWLNGIYPDIPAALQQYLVQWMAHPQLLAAVFNDVQLAVKQADSLTRFPDLAINRDVTKVGHAVFQERVQLQDHLHRLKRTWSFDATDKSAKLERHTAACAKCCKPFVLDPRILPDDSIDHTSPLNDDIQQWQIPWTAPPVVGTSSAINSYEADKQRIENDYLQQSRSRLSIVVDTASIRPVAAPVQTHIPNVPGPPTEWKTQVADGVHVHPHCTHQSLWTPILHLQHHYYTLVNHLQMRLAYWQTVQDNETEPMSRRLIPTVYKLWYYFYRFKTSLDAIDWTSLTNDTKQAVATRNVEYQRERYQGVLALFAKFPKSVSSPAVTDAVIDPSAKRAQQLWRDHHTYFEACFPKIVDEKKKKVTPPTLAK